METRILKRIFSFMVMINMLITVPFIVSATPPKTSKKHCHSYSDGGSRNEISLGRIIYNNKVEEYKKRGYEDGFNNIPASSSIPKGYLKIYEEEYKKGQLIQNKSRDKLTKSNIDSENISFSDNRFYVDEDEKEDKVINLKKNVIINKIYDNKKNNEQEKYDKKLEEYKKKGYEDGIKNRVMVTTIPKKYESVYEREYRKGLVTYIKDNLKNQTIDFGKIVPTTAEKAKKLGEMHGLNDVPYRIGAPEDIQEEYGKAYFSAKRNKLFEKGYYAAIKNKNKKTLKKTYIIKVYGHWYNAGFEYGREEDVKQLEKSKKQGYVDGLKKHVRRTNIPKEYEKGREKYIENMMEKIRKHRMKMKIKYGK